MRQERSVWIALPLLLAAVAAEEPRDRPLGGIERLARGLQKKVHCAGLSAFECVQCLSPGSMASLVAGNDTNETVGDRQRERLSVLLLERLTDMRQPCNVGRCGTYEQCRAALQLASPGRLARLEDILRRVKAVYVPTNRHKCFTAEDVLNSLVPYEQNEEAYVEKVATSVITHLSQAVTPRWNRLQRPQYPALPRIVIRTVPLTIPRPVMNGPPRHLTIIIKTVILTTMAMNTTMKPVLAIVVPQCAHLEASPLCNLVQTSWEDDDAVSRRFRTTTSTTTTVPLQK
ncbi:hypothetical protein HPB52_012999 [Rhipicephalus sanguineus]|uniref:Zinc transporter ZIP4 N-terminal domain-containing protein n=1 Tax=Rhipicephalus sanguineus TaxID=34632 RepID=A0A9D4PRR8_RHISA|nr:hypothetical protein HPB52_012999 [Rhipicephalus sanguineus]